MDILIVYSVDFMIWYSSIIEQSPLLPAQSRLMPKINLHTCISWSLIWYIKTPCLFPNPSLTWTVSLYHTCHNSGMISSLITTKTLFYWANADENGFLHVFSLENLLNSRMVIISRRHERAETCSSHVNKSSWPSFLRSSQRKTWISCTFKKLLKYVDIHTYIIYYWKYRSVKQAIYTCFWPTSRAYILEL